MLLDDAFEIFRGTGMVPDRIGVNHRDWPVGADAQAISFAALDQGLMTAKPEFIQAVLEKLPGSRPLFKPTALGFGGSGTKENVPLVATEIQSSGRRFQKVSHGGIKAQWGNEEREQWGEKEKPVFFQRFESSIAYPQAAAAT